METNDKTIFKDSFIPYIIKWGRGLNLLGVLLSFGPCIALAMMGILPPWDALAAGFAMQFPLVMSAYIYEPISYFAVLGIPGSYMAFLSGNISNLRVPASAVSQNAAGVEQGSDEGTIIATIGVAVSTFVNIIFLTTGILVGSFLLARLSPQVTAALNLLLPALFASLFINYAMQNYKLAGIATVLCFSMAYVSLHKMLSFLPGALSSAIPILVCVFGTMTIGILMAKKGRM